VEISAARQFDGLVDNIVQLHRIKSGRAAGTAGDQAEDAGFPFLGAPPTFG